MTTSIVTSTKSIVRDVQATAKGVIHTLRGEWKPNTKYSVNDYVYTSNYPGFIYVATTSGTSQSETSGRTSLEEPAWSIFNTYTYDGALQFIPIEIAESIISTIKKWSPNTVINAGDFILPSSGPIIVKGEKTQFYAFKLKKCITNIDWPREPREYLQDNDIIWECRVSYGKLLPAARLKEPLYKELVEIMDFLRLHEEVFFDDLTYKYADQLRTRSISIKEVIAEFGYNYITDFLGLENKELQSCMEYISLIHYLKGHEKGLSLIFELLGVSARWEEWWEAVPIGEPDTWKLWVDVDVATAASFLMTKIINFTRQYVYPIMKEFEVTYKVDLIKLGAAIGGFIDKSYYISASAGTMMMQGIGGYADKEYNFSLHGIVHHVLGKEDFYLYQVFGFRSMIGRIGTWGSMWSKYFYNTKNRNALAVNLGITEEEALALLSTDICKKDEHNHPVDENKE